MVVLRKYNRLMIGNRIVDFINVNSGSIESFPETKFGFLNW